MPKKSKETIKWHRLAELFTLCSILCMFGPILFYSISAFIGGAAIIQKFALTSSLLVVGIMTVICVLKKWVARSRIWIIMITLSICLPHFMVLFYVFAITQIADELIFCPLAKYCKDRYKNNKDIDKRLQGDKQ